MRDVNRPRRLYVFMMISGKWAGMCAQNVEAPRMLRIDRKSLQAPARVLDLELAPVNQVDEDTLAVENYDIYGVCLGSMAFHRRSRSGMLPKT